MRYRILFLLTWTYGQLMAAPGAWLSPVRDREAIKLTSKITVKVLTIAMFEVGEPTGDTPGEAQFWIERQKMKKRYKLPGAFSPLYCAEDGHCLIVTGMGTANATASLMAIGMNPNVDISKAYLMVAGIGGANPEMVSLGTAVWARWAVDNDDSHHIDARELPKTWKFTNFHLGCVTPWCDDGWRTGTEVYSVNSRLNDLAYQISKEATLQDNDTAAQYRKQYPENLPARRPPFVAKCDVVSGGSYFHGSVMSHWATWWVDKWTGGEGRYCAAGMEETGLLTAMTRLGEAGLADEERFMILRVAANFDQQHPKQTALESLHAQSGGYPLALENAYRAGSKVSDHIIKNWERWEKAIPLAIAE